MNTRTIITKVAGVTFKGRQAYLHAMYGNEPVRIVPEPTNPYDPNALAVHIAIPEGGSTMIRHVGYIPRELAAQIAPWLDGEAVMARIAAITGGFETWDGELATLGLRLEIEIPESEA